MLKPEEGWSSAAVHAMLAADCNRLIAREPSAETLYDVIVHVRENPFRIGVPIASSPFSAELSPRTGVVCALP